MNYLRATAHTKVTMEQNVITSERRRLSDMSLFWLCLIGTVGVGLTLSYCSGILRGINYLGGLPFALPAWFVIAIPPMLFVIMGVSLFMTVRMHANGMLRAWTWVFWLALLGMTATLPYAICYNNPVGAYVMSTIASALAIGTAILMYRQSIAAGVMITVVFVWLALIMLYLGFWAFA